MYALEKIILCTVLGTHVHQIVPFGGIIFLEILKKSAAIVLLRENFCNLKHNRLCLTGIPHIFANIFPFRYARQVNDLPTILV